MKFISIFSKKQFFILLSFVLIMLSGNISSLLHKKTSSTKEKAIESSTTSRNSKHKRSRSNAILSSSALNSSNITNSSFNISMRTKMESLMNESKFEAQDENQFFHSHNSFLANKLLDKEILEIFNFFRTKKFVTSRYDTRSAIELFLNDFEKCSPNKTYVLDLKQFQRCMSTDPSLKRIIPPSNAFANYNNYSDPKDTNKTAFKTLLFKTMDKMHENYLNFYDYLILRLFVFSWAKCSVNGPYLDESSFECAIDIVINWRSLDRQTARNIYNFAIKISPNAERTRHIDFLSFINIASSIRVYSMINTKGDSDATKAEFNNALDNNLLPIRYNQKVIDDFFKLVCDDDNPNQGIDVLTFWFFDSILRIFFGESKGEKRWQADFNQFAAALDSGFFPSHLQKYIQLIPQYTLKNSSYMMEAYDNIKYFKTEEDFLMMPKFLEKNLKEKASTLITTSIANSNLNNLKTSNSKNTKNLNTISKTNSKNTYKFSSVVQTLLKTRAAEGYDKNATNTRIFTVLDSDEDGFIDFYDFGMFIQITTLFADADEHNRGRVVAGVLHEKLSESSGLPTLNSKFRDRAKRFGLINQDVNFDVFNAIVLMKMDEIAFHYARKEDPSLVFEIDMKQIFLRIGLVNIPDGHVKNCIRGPIGEGYTQKKYDWECAIIIGLKETLDFIEQANDLTKVKKNNINIVMTTFKNKDPVLL